MVENASVWSILSKGIHELEEKECNEYFPSLKIFIETVLEEWLNKKEKEKLNKKLSAEINNITQKIK